MKDRLLKIFLTLPLVIVCLVFVVPRAKAAQSENDLIKHIVSVLHLSMPKQAGLIEKGEPFKDENSYSAVIASASEVKVSLTDGLKVFFSSKKAYSAIEDIYEKENHRDKYRALFGINIAF